MFLPGDPRIIKNTQEVREMERKYPDRDWRYGLSKEQQEQVEKWRKEAEEIKKDTE